MLHFDLELLQHISTEVNFVLNTAKDKAKDDVMNDPILFRAVVRAIEIIGEASKKLSDEFKNNYPEMEWKKIGRTRDVLIHAYFSIDNDIIWTIVQDKLPPLQIFLSKLHIE